MKTTSASISEMVNKIYLRLKDINDKLQIYMKEEQKKFNGSNMTLAVSESEISELNEISKYLLNKNTQISSYYLEPFIEKYKIFFTTAIEFESDIEKVRSSERGSLDHPFFYSKFSNLVIEIIYIIRDIVDTIEEKIKFEDVNKHLQNLETNSKLSDRLKEEYTQKIASLENQTKNLLLKLEQTVNEKKVSDIKEFYQSYLKNSKLERTIYGLIYGSTFLLIIYSILYLFEIYLSKTEGNYLWQLTTLTFTFFGFLTFLLKDSRKRFNISKGIIDDISQKSAVVDIYSNLLSKIQEFDEETKKAYNMEILKNIINTLLSTKNYGYNPNESNSSNSNDLSDLLDIVKKQIDKS
ncbi:hypothetical protein [Leptospira bandrabouensis]|uniref:hypothetical protein n=1 Tax=Leptospira bandrabouensis TaxID=2484903 RepID=UPI001EE8F8B8|nr:hypothetical protein [Leptospira bandrabouensis]MCG6146583.1 hypothetical protein [Leptospira bandrabouensis]MCG6161956.1 hypothetical protein [Leptospira bandrabouensis]MCG6166151.1 hypothetical protein [Leptospira bandrabouensis]